LKEIVHQQFFKNAINGTVHTYESLLQNMENCYGNSWFIKSGI